MKSSEPSFTAEEVRSMIEHMNEDHGDSVLAYAQHFGGCPEAISAVLLDIRPAQMTILATSPGGQIEVKVEYDHVLEDTHDAHMTLIRMSKEAKAALGM